jgi:hypothetical protein
MNDFCIDHASCSRVHAVLVYHKHLDRAFLVDLNSSMFGYIYLEKGMLSNAIIFSAWNIYRHHEIRGK